MYSLGCIEPPTKWIKRRQKIVLIVNHILVFKIEEMVD